MVSCTVVELPSTPMYAELIPSLRNVYCSYFDEIESVDTPDEPQLL